MIRCVVFGLASSIPVTVSPATISEGERAFHAIAASMNEPTLPPYSCLQKEIKGSKLYLFLASVIFFTE
jgi:hypothetical protein